jgi:hypothetical protein
MPCSDSDWPLTTTSVTWAFSAHGARGCGTNLSKLGSQSSGTEMDPRIHRVLRVGSVDGFGYSYPISLMDPRIHRGVGPAGAMNLGIHRRGGMSRPGDRRAASGAAGGAMLTCGILARARARARARA